MRWLYLSAIRRAAWRRWHARRRGAPPTFDREDGMQNDHAHKSSDRQRPSSLWWGYFALLFVLGGVGLFTSATAGVYDSFTPLLVTAITLGFDLVNIVGLYGYIRSIPLLAAAFWRVMLILLLARFLLTTSLFISDLFPWERTHEQYVALAGLLSPLLALPLLWALWRYAFRSAFVWRQVSRRTAESV
jgi:hypothetical protein